MYFYSFKAIDGHVMASSGTVLLVVSKDRINILLL